VRFQIAPAKNGVKICQCISCGLSTRGKPAKKKKVCYDTECIECKFRDNDTHEGPCKDCEESFQVFSDLFRLAERTKTLPNLSPPEREKYLELELEVKKCRQNLVDWRSHIVRKKVESKFTCNLKQSLKQNEAIVVSDYKMKILATYFRENQKKFFAKRGTSCLGFMILTNVDSKEGTVDVNFVLLFSNDTTQDANFVLAAKAYIYSDFLPTLFPDDIETINVNFESDGAGCFNSSILKGCQPHWREWTEGKVEEVQVRHSVNGDGKTALDGVFGRLGGNLRAAINNGSKDITDAETCVAAFEDGAGIRGAAAAIFRPVRGDDLENRNKNLTHYHRIVLDRENDAFRCWRHSGFGKGVVIGFKTISNGWNAPPQMPDYFVTSQLPTVKSESESDHSTISKQSRDKKIKVSRQVAKSEARRKK